jgi:Cu(I)/Ag(I) efflux system membrane protein CusA/SilA
VGLKIAGPDPRTVDAIGARIEHLLASVPGTRSVFSERTGAGYFIDLDWNRDELARQGVSLDEAQAAVENAIGGENVTTTIEGRGRYSVDVRYQRDDRSDLDALRRVMVSVAGGQRQLPLGQLATVQVVTGPSMLRNEDGMLTGYVYVDVVDRDASRYVDDADRVLRAQLHVEPGYSYAWSGQYEAIERVRARLVTIVPLTLLLIFLLIYLNTRSLSRTLIVLLAVPFSAVGAIGLVALLGYNLSVGVWVGLIALLGVDAETGIFMLLYLDLAYEGARRAGRLRDLGDLRAAIVEGVAKRIRPKFMTAATMFMGLVPIMWANGTGADVMKRIAAPMIGGIFTSFVLELVVYPAVYETWRWWADWKGGAQVPTPPAP